jgi:aldehyde dehydrogenase (NAD+)
VTTATISTTYSDLDKNFIDGVWRDGASGARGADTNPYDGSTLHEYTFANAADVDAAYRAAHAAQPAWAALLPRERSAIIAKAAAILMARKDECVDWLVREAGSTRIKAEIEVGLVHGGMIEAATIPSHIIGQILPANTPGKTSYVYREPVGVVCIISPFNFPFQLANRSVSPALACGNAIVVKPASDTPVTGALLLAKIYEEAGLPKGVFNVVVGSGATIGDAVVEHPIPKVVSFTGSTPVGTHLAGIAAKHTKRVCLELGGNAPFLVLADADLDRAVDAAIFGKFCHQGQICMAINRILVDRAIYDAFVERFTARARALRVGDPSDPRTVVGPIINAKQVADIKEKVEKVKASGVRVLMEFHAEGNVVSPVVLADVKNEHAQEEFFGPVAVIVPFDGDDEGVRLANDVPFGLTSSVFSRDLARALAAARRIDAGMTHINDQPVNDEANTAFGGEKASGLGRFGGEWAIREFTTDHWISVQETPRQYPF